MLFLQEADNLIYHHCRISSGCRQKIFKFNRGVDVCTVGNGTYYNKRNVEIVTDLGDGSPFHFTGCRPREILQNFVSLLFRTDELIAADNQTDNILGSGASLGKIYQFVICGEGRRLTRNLADLLAEIGKIYIVVGNFA